MDITSFFEPETTEKKVPKKKSKQNKIKNLIADKKTRYLELLNQCVKEESIDLLDYTRMVEFYKKRGPLVCLPNFFAILEKIKKNIEVYDEIRDISSILFPHVFQNLENNKVSSNKLLAKISSNNKDHLTFSNDQKCALVNIFNFLLSDKDYTYGLYGFAGTGKTTLVIELVYFLLKNNYLTSIVLTAPTNKAVNIMKAKFRYELKRLVEEKIDEYDANTNFDDNLDKLQNIGIRVDFITIHKLLNYQNEFDIEGNRVFVKGKNSNILKYDLVIIDECSMIQLDIISNIFDDLNKEIKKQSKTNMAKQLPKVVFVGDPAQLPPVSEDVSAIFGLEFNYSYYEKIVNENDEEKESFYTNQNVLLERFNKLKLNIKQQKSYTLEQVVRSKDDKIVGLCNNVRNWVMGDIKFPEISAYKGNGVYLYKYDKKGKHNSKWFKKYLNTVANNNSIILTWTNKQTDDYNMFTRKHLFKNRDNINTYEKGDTLILTDFYNFDESEFKDKKTNDKRFYTSEQIKIADVDRLIKAVGPIPEYIGKKVSNMKNSRIIMEKYKAMTKIMNTKTKRKYNIWKLYTHKLNDTLENKIPELYEINVVHDSSKQDLEKDLEFCTDKIKILRKFYKNYYSDQMTQIDREIIKPLWKQVNKCFVDPFANVSRGNSITCHKSQGSTFYNIFVDADDILRNTKHNEAKRCIYTSLTRASNQIHILF